MFYSLRMILIIYYFPIRLFYLKNLLYTNKHISMFLHERKIVMNTFQFEQFYGNRFVMLNICYIEIRMTKLTD